MKIVIILSFLLMYFVLWCFLRVASIADREYEKTVNSTKKKKRIV